MDVRFQDYEEIRKPHTPKERAADAIARIVGSWAFLTIQSTLIVVWVVVNIHWAGRWDPYPFILLNLMLSFQAAYTAPIIMMSHNRHAAIDRTEAHLDFKTNQLAEEEARTIIAMLERQEKEIAEIKTVLRKHVSNGKV